MNVRNLLVFGLMILLFSGCSDDEPSTQNSIKLDGQKFNVTAATIAGVAISGEGHAAISFVYATNTTSKTLNIDVEYAGDSDVSGDYSFPQAGGDLLLIDALSYYTEMTTGGNLYNTTLISGEVTIVKNSADNYSVQMHLVMDDGKVFSGTYKGKFITQFSNQ